MEDALEHIASRLPEITEGARWAWPMGYERRKGERSSGGGQVSRPTEAAVGHGWWKCDATCQSHPKGNEMHPPSPEWTMRHEVERIGQWVLQAAALLEASTVALERIGKAAAKGDRGTEEELMVRTASRAEVERANRAKRKRDNGRARGVGYGEY